VAHDITADRSTLRAHVTTEELHNVRSPRLNLETLYGDGPISNPFLVRADDSAKFLLGADGADLQRNSEGVAIIGDPRNDSHGLISQLHLAMQRAHNAFVDEAREGGTKTAELFEEAAKQLRWHYQWIILNEFLPAVVGEELADQVRREGPKYFHPGRDGFIPVEFAHAAYRYGHSQIRHRYRLNSGSDAVALFPELLGFRAVPRERRVDWKLFFDSEDAAPAQRSKKIDGKLVRSLIQLPLAVSGECEFEEYSSLAVRDLQRGQELGLPSGEEVARHMGVAPISVAQVGVTELGWTRETPLWYYIQREADVCTGGQHLGPVGGRIVADVLVGLIDGDATSYRKNRGEWRPQKNLSQLLNS
jgi:hypothetical protein